MEAGPPIEVAKTRTEPASEPRKSRARSLLLPAVIALMALAFCFFPQTTLTTLPDHSWERVIIWAHQNGLQFGHDLVFTYGPLGFLATSGFTPDVAVTRILFEAVLSIVIATGFCLVAWRTAPVWRVVLLVFFLTVTMPLHWGGSALFIDIGLFAWGLLCFLESGLRLPFYALVLTVLAAVGALVKFTFLAGGLFTVMVVAFDLALRRRRALAFGMVPGMVLAFLVGWMLLGQSLAGLREFLSNSAAITEGYNQAMGQDLGSTVTILILLMAAVTFAAAVARCVSMPPGEGGSALQRWTMLLWIVGLLFLNWKYMSVRVDYLHLKLLFGFMPLVAICLEAIPTTATRAALRGRVAAVLCLAIALFLVWDKIFIHYFPFKGPKQAFLEFCQHVGVLTQPGRYLREKTELFRAEQQLEQLPRIRSALGRATVDVFGQKQASVFANELNYHSRPVFQSYSAYTRQLMELNEQFYLSSNAPEYVLFDLHPIDGRFPPLEDAFVLRHLLLNYSFDFQEQFLVLQRKGTTSAQLTLLKEGTIHAGEKLDLRGARGANLWLEIELQPTSIGRLRKLFYKPPGVRLKTPDPAKTGATLDFNAPASMLAAGFLASPMLLNDEDALKLYTGGDVFRPDWYAVEPVASPLSAWQPEIRYRLYRIENLLAHSEK